MYEIESVERQLEKLDEILKNNLYGCKYSTSIKSKMGVNFIEIIINDKKYLGYYKEMIPDGMILLSEKEIKFFKNVMTYNKYYDTLIASNYYDKNEYRRHVENEFGEEILQNFSKINHKTYLISTYPWDENVGDWVKNFDLLTRTSKKEVEYTYFYPRYGTNILNKFSDGTFEKFSENTSDDIRVSVYNDDDEDDNEDEFESVKFKK